MAIYSEFLFDRPDESAGLLRSARHWLPVEQAALAFGQGVSVTPIQLVAAMATLANRGQWMRPRLVAARRGADREHRQQQRQRRYPVHALGELRLALRVPRIDSVCETRYLPRGK